MLLPQAVSSPNFALFFVPNIIFCCGDSKSLATHKERRWTKLTLTVFPSELAAPIIGDGIFPKEKIPLERSGTEEDMAGCILFLTSKAGAYCTGNVLVLDGGRLSLMPSTY